MANEKVKYIIYGTSFMALMEIGGHLIPALINFLHAIKVI